MPVSFCSPYCPRAAAIDRHRPAGSARVKMPRQQTGVQIPKPSQTAQVYDHQGVRVAFELLPARSAPVDAAGFREGDDVVFRFTITDPASGEGIAKAHPAAWMAPRVEGEPRDALAAAKTIARFLRGDRFSRPTLDLNVFYALTMNDDATVSVVDPLFGFGNTKLLAMILLKGNAVDWALSDDQSRLYLASPLDRTESPSSTPRHGPNLAPSRRSSARRVWRSSPTAITFGRPIATRQRAARAWRRSPPTARASCGQSRPGAGITRSGSTAMAGTCSSPTAMTAPFRSSRSALWPGSPTSRRAMPRYPWRIRRHRG